MILRFSYKDPDFIAYDVDGKIEISPINDLKDEDFRRLKQLGLAGEYIIIEVDTISGHTRVVP